MTVDPAPDPGADAWPGIPVTVPEGTEDPPEQDGGDTDAVTD